MLNIILQDREIELEFDGIKIFHTSHPTKLYRDLFINTKILIDNKLISDDNIVYLNELTKISDFVNLNKKSFLFKEIIDLLHENQIINIENLSKICNKINQTHNINLLDISIGDQNKIINYFFELINSDYLYPEVMKIIFNKVFDAKKLIIFDNVSWINFDLLSEYMNEHYFIIISNDVRKHISRKMDLELIVNFNENNNFLEIIDSNIAIANLENKMNCFIDDQKFNDLNAKIDTIESSNYLFFLKNM